MKCVESNVIEEEAPITASVIRMPEGLLGFEKVKSYQLLGSVEEAPFLWLQMDEEPRLSFLVIEPALALSSYQPDIPEADIEAIGLTAPEDALVLNIVTIHADGKATVNLKGPILINRKTLAARQSVPLNASEYSLQHPLPIAKA
jgi:flagellar assembly factor FliW